MDQAQGAVKAFLKQIYGDKINEEYRLTGSKVIIGRHPKNQIVLSNLSVSRRHCILNFSKDGWRVTDCKSQNGTFINGRRLMPDENHLLQCGDIVFLGPPSEMPQTFSYDEIYPSEESMNTDLQDIWELHGKRTFNYVEVSPEKTSKKVLKTSGEHTTMKSSDDSPDSSFTEPIHNVASNEIKKTKANTSENVYEDVDFIPLFQVSSLESKISYSDDQINEISSTGSEHFEHSESLLFVENDDASSAFSQKAPIQNKISNPDKCRTKSDEKKEKELESKVALLYDEIKSLQKAQLELLKNYEGVCEKNKELDEQLANKEKKLKEDLKHHETKAKNEIKSELLQKFEEELICNICTELFIKPTVLDCSHTFCEYCIKEWKKKKNDCPICRCKIKNATRVRTLEGFIDKALATLTPDQREKRNNIVAQRVIAEQPLTPDPNSTPRRRRHRHRRMRPPRSNRSNNSNDNSIEIVEESSDSRRTRSNYINLQVPSDDINVQVNLPVLDIPMLSFFFS